jgi:glycerol uptake facilitator-like aquaporin
VSRHRPDLLLMPVTSAPRTDQVPLLARQAAAEFIGSALLAATVVGSGIAAQRLSPQDIGLQLLENALITGAVLVALILALGPVSAAFNPVVTLVERALGAVTTAAAALFVACQVAGCCLGVMLANLMFDLPAVNISNHDRPAATCSSRRPSLPSALS